MSCSNRESAILCSVMGTPLRGVFACCAIHGCECSTPGETKIAHTPPNLVVGGCRRTLIASRREDLQVEHPVQGREVTALDFHPTLARVQGPALIGNQVVQVRQAGKKRGLIPCRMV